MNLKCYHFDMKILGVNTEDYNLELECVGCSAKVKVDVTTLPSFHFHLPTKEYVERINIEAKIAGMLALRDYDALVKKEKG